MKKSLAKVGVGVSMGGLFQNKGVLRNTPLRRRFFKREEIKKFLKKIKKFKNSLDKGK